MSQVRFLKPEYFIWTLVPLGIMASLVTLGMPHVIWSYEYRVVSFNPREGDGRRYIRCTYISTRNAITEYPLDGQCGWVRFGK